MTFVQNKKNFKTISISRRGFKFLKCDLYPGDFNLLNAENCRLKESNFSRCLPLNPKRGFSLIFQDQPNGNFFKAPRRHPFQKKRHLTIRERGVFALWLYIVVWRFKLVIYFRPSGLFSFFRFNCPNIYLFMVN